MLEPQSTVLFVLLIAIFGVLMWRTLAARRAAFCGRYWDCVTLPPSCGGSVPGPRYPAGGSAIMAVPISRKPILA